MSHVIVCYSCGQHTVPYAEVRYSGSDKQVYEACQGCIGTMREIGKMKSANLDGIVAAYEVFRRMDWRLSQLLERINAIETRLDAKV